MRILLLSLLMCSLCFAGGSRKMDNTSSTQNWIESSSTVTTSIDSGDFTIVAWVNRESDTTDVFQAFAGMGTYSPGMYVEYNTGYPGIYLGSGGNFDSTSVPTTQWIHLGFRRSGTTITFWRDGVADTATITNSGTFADDTLRLFTSAVGSYCVDGNAADFRLYNRALSEAEIKCVMRGSAVPKGLEVHWPLMDNGSSPTYKDLSGNGRTGTNNGTATESTDGPPSTFSGG